MRVFVGFNLISVILRFFHVLSAASETKEKVRILHDGYDPLDADDVTEWENEQASGKGESVFKFFFQTGGGPGRTVHQKPFEDLFRTFQAQKQKFDDDADDAETRERQRQAAYGSGRSGQEGPRADEGQREGGAHGQTQQQQYEQQRRQQQQHQQQQHQQQYRQQQKQQYQQQYEQHRQQHQQQQYRQQQQQKQQQQYQQQEQQQYRQQQQRRQQQQQQQQQQQRFSQEQRQQTQASNDPKYQDRGQDGRQQDRGRPVQDEFARQRQTRAGDNAWRGVPRDGPDRAGFGDKRGRSDEHARREGEVHQEGHARKDFTEEHPRPDGHSSQNADEAKERVSKGRQNRGGKKKRKKNKSKTDVSEKDKDEIHRYTKGTDGKWYFKGDDGRWKVHDGPPPQAHKKKKQAPESPGKEPNGPEQAQKSQSREASYTDENGNFFVRGADGNWYMRVKPPSSGENDFQRNTESERSHGNHQAGPDSARNAQTVREEADKREQFQEKLPHGLFRNNRNEVSDQIGNIYEKQRNGRFMIVRLSEEGKARLRERLQRQKDEFNKRVREEREKEERQRAELERAERERAGQRRPNEGPGTAKNQVFRDGMGNVFVKDAHGNLIKVKSGGQSVSPGPDRRRHDRNINRWTEDEDGDDYPDDEEEGGEDFEEDRESGFYRRAGQQAHRRRHHPGQSGEDLRHRERPFGRSPAHEEL